MTFSNNSVDAGDPAVLAEVSRLRDSIDNIDAAVVYMLAERFKCTEQVSHLKAGHRLPSVAPAREAEQIARLRRLAEDARLDPVFAEKLLNFIIAEARGATGAHKTRPGSPRRGWSPGLPPMACIQMLTANEGL
jgi:chorismate mutase